MTKQVQRRRGTATQHTSFTGAEGELSVNTTNKSVHVHDNVTAGGFELARVDMDNVTSSSILTAAGITATTAELNFVDGVTSAIQTQIDGKAGTASPTFTGTLTTANLTATGTTTLAGASTSADITFGDNDKAIFGSGSDLQVYHDGGNSLIQDTGQGDLILKSNGAATVIKTNAGNNLLSARDAGSVGIFYDNSEVLTSTSTGVDVTGSISADGLTVDGVARVQGGSPFLYLDSNSNTGTSRIYFGDADSDIIGSMIYGHTSDDLVITTGASERLSLSGAEAVFNDVGFDVDFRVESDSNANMLVVDAGNNQVVVGTSSPITGIGAVMTLGGGVDTRLAIDGSSSSGLYLSDSGAQGITIRNASGDLEFYGIATREFVFNEDGIDTDFRVESDSNTHALFVNAAAEGGQGAVGIGTSNPQRKFVVSEQGANGIEIDPNISGTSEIISYNRSTNAYTPLNFAASSIELNATGTGAVIVNQGGNDTDFRVESDGNTHALFVDASANVVGLGISNPNSYYATDLVIAASNNGGITIRNTTDTTSTNYIMFADGDSGADRYRGMIQYTHNDDRMVFSTNATGRLELSAVESVFNNGAGDTDFRVESDNHTHALFVDAGLDLVGIDQSAPSYLLDVGNGTSSPPSGYVMRINSSGDTIFSHSRANTSLMSFRNDQNSYVAIASNNSAALMLGYSDNGAGAISNHQIFLSGETVINEGSANRDFRVESDNVSHMLFLDASSNRVSVGRSNPLDTLHVQAYASTDSAARFEPNTINPSVSASDPTVIVLSQKAPTLDLNRYYSHGTIVQFRHNNDAVGSIYVNGSSTTYYTSSDYRLKENVVELTGATDRLKQLQPKRFNFIADADTTVDGFLAHEVQSIVPEAIGGTKDEVDDEGNPVYQGIDQSKLVPLLVATIKELEARITALENA